VATAFVTSNQDTIVSEVGIAAPAERVFAAIAEADTVRRRSPHLDVFEMDLKVGGKWRLEMRVPKPHHGVSVVRHGGQILELDRLRLLVHTWKANFHQDPMAESVVRWELTETKSGTHVKVTHSGLASETAARNAYAGGWPGVLAELKTFAERSET
jgi:uncharacterized protein YndB with AHSA1/START domain